MCNEKCKMQNGTMRRAGDDILERLLAFAVRIGKVVDALSDTRMGRHIAGQLIRCGTSPAPNYAEACGAESKRDFVHKLGVCLKELRESACWIQMITKAELLPEPRLSVLSNECDELVRIIAKPIVTAKSNASARTRLPE